MAELKTIRHLDGVESIANNGMPSVSKGVDNKAYSGYYDTETTPTSKDDNKDNVKDSKVCEKMPFVSIQAFIWLLNVKIYLNMIFLIVHYQLGGNLALVSGQSLISLCFSSLRVNM
jgi:hypothetical protein